MSTEFEKITANKLDQGAIVPQALDNQWAPTKVLKSLTSRGTWLIRWKERKKFVLSEWRRSLVYAPQVVVNRAALINNSVVVDDYSGESKKQFQELLSQKVIIDYLLTEESPEQRPTFDISDAKWEKWLGVIRDTKVACVRLDWGEQKDNLKNVASVFHGYIQHLNMPDLTEHLTNAFNIPKRKRDNFRKKLIEVARYAFDSATEQKTVVRNDLYKKFVCVDGSKIDDGVYDKNKPFAVELKEIFDLRYTVNLPDALGRYAFTPKGSPDRTLLGDLSSANFQKTLNDKTVENFIDSLKRLQFATLNDALYIKGLHLLSLADVLEIRNTDEWAEYIADLDALLSAPMKFEEKVDNVSTTFTKLNRKITDLKVAKLKGSTTDMISRAQPVMMIVVAIGGAAFKLFTDPTNPSNILVDSLAGPISIGLAPLAVNLKIMSEAQVDLGISINFMRSKVNQGKEVWQEIRGALKSDPRFKVIDTDETKATQDADQSKNENDPNDIL